MPEEFLSRDFLLQIKYSPAWFEEWLKNRGGIRCCSQSKTSSQASAITAWVYLGVALQKTYVPRSSSIASCVGSVTMSTSYVLRKILSRTESDISYVWCWPFPRMQVSPWKNRNSNRSSNFKTCHSLPVIIQCKSC